MALRLLCILAHPDDETLGIGGTLAHYAADPDVETFVLMATRGEYGWWGEEKDYPGPDELGRTREAELRAAVEVLGVQELEILDYIDGHLDEADTAEAVGRMAAYIRKVRPEVVVTFPPDGIYGHPDHIAICQFATAAVVAATEPPAEGEELSHAVQKLYYRVHEGEDLQRYEEAFGELVMHIDGVERRATSWPAWAMTARLDASRHWQRVWEAVQKHRSQLPGYEKLQELKASDHELFWGRQDYYRVFSLVNGGRAVERDLFEGLR
jgi:LmbE family N-acetylglucosaminyl deacetylase